MIGSAATTGLTISPRLRCFIAALTPFLSRAPDMPPSATVPVGHGLPEAVCRPADKFAPPRHLGGHASCPGTPNSDPLVAAGFAQARSIDEEIGVGWLFSSLPETPAEAV